MKLFSLFLASTAAYNCPANSAQKLADVAPLTIQDCACDSGFHAMPFPANECVSDSGSFTCPANSEVKVMSRSARSMADCKCSNGYVAYNKQCTYAYVFHVHGRAYLRTADEAALKTEFEADESKFQRAMAGALTADTTAQDVLPYRLEASTAVSKMISDSLMDKSRIIIAHGHGGKTEATVDSGLVVSFAVHERGDSMTDGNTLVDELKSSSVLSKIDAKLNNEFDASITSSDVFVWALTAQFWHPPASVAVCDHNHRGDKALSTGLNDNTVENTHLDAQKDSEACASCVQDWQCQPADCYKNGKQVAFDANQLKRGVQVCKTQPTCSAANDGTGHFCFRPYTWANKYENNGSKATRPPTKPATQAPTQKWKRAKVEVPVTFTGIAPAQLSYTSRAGLLIDFAKLIGVDTQDVFYIRLNPKGRRQDRATYDDHTDPTIATDGYSAAHHIWKATDVVFGVYTYTHQQAKDVLSEVAKESFCRKITKKANMQLENVASQVKGSPITACETKAPVVVPYKMSVPTILPTAAPTHQNVMPGADGSCTDGTVMEIRGSARVQSLYNLEAPVNRAMTFMDKQSSGLRACMTKHAQASITDAQKDAKYVAAQWCNMVVLNWNVKKVAIFEDALAAHQHDDRGEKRFSKYAYIYTFAFVLAVPGQNMHVGNEVFNTMKSGNAFLSTVNYCTSGRTNTGTVLVPELYHDGTKLAQYDEDMFNQPMVESMNLTSIELTYVARTPTHAPTTPPTFEDRDCELSDPSAATACSHTCGPKGVSRVWRIIETPSSGNGAKCGSVGFETVTVTECNRDVICPANCIVGQYSDWGKCSVSCDEGTRTRTRQLTLPSNGGDACPLSYDTMACVEKACPVDCVTSDLNSDAVCTKTCGGGTMTQYRRITTAPAYGGKACMSLTETTPCNQQACPENCEVSKWSAWGSCSKTCAGKPAGTRLFGARQERTRYVTQNANGDGVQCPALTQQRLCALHPCGAHVCTTDHGFPLTCTYENGVVYTHHVNDVHDNELFMCYHNYVTEVCTCLCWAKSSLAQGFASGETGIERVSRKSYDENKIDQPHGGVSAASDVSLFTAHQQAN